ncbi:MAG TPA: ATP-binding protein [bacterium]|jgi:serine/threonine-protein kinase RsbW|nr:ATP-binding protein [bacterium]HNT66666.1 ATP-binding protein [bacterium]HOX87220.1 ATP-binding protein [bacterium]HPG46681.1 ATP-binding protein [bacterium]HPM98787.1 ATP-binding protein [bacterium]
MKEKIVEMDIPSDPAQIQRVEKQTEKLARKLGFSADDLDSLAIAVTEVVANAIYHGNKCDPQKKVKIRFTITTAAFVVSVMDQGRGFCPDELGNPVAPENLLKGSGRGIFIVQALIDRVTFKFHPSGTEVILIKYRRREGKPKTLANEG